MLLLIPPCRLQAIPSSLRNIYKEIKEDVGATIPPHGNLEKVGRGGTQGRLLCCWVDLCQRFCQPFGVQPVMLD